MNLAEHREHRSSACDARRTRTFACAGKIGGDLASASRVDPHARVPGTHPVGVGRVHLVRVVRLRARGVERTRDGEEVLPDVRELAAVRHADGPCVAVHVVLARRDLVCFGLSRVVSVPRRVGARAGLAFFNRGTMSFAPQPGFLCTCSQSSKSDATALL